MKQFLQKAFNVLLCIIGITVFVIGLSSILPYQTDLAKNNSKILMGQISEFNYLVTICGFYTCIKGLQKI